MAYILKTDRGTFSFTTEPEAEEGGRISYVTGGTPAYIIEEDPEAIAYHCIQNDKIIPLTARKK